VELIVEQGRTPRTQCFSRLLGVDIIGFGSATDRLARSGRVCDRGVNREVPYIVRGDLVSRN
jgi:hypothetical protein